MKPSFYKLSLVTLIACALALSPGQSFAQENKEKEKSAENKPENKGDEKKAPNPNRPLPFRGKVDAVDKVAKTVKVGERVFHVTAETRIQKDGKPATLDDAVVGEPIRGSLRKMEDGKLNAVSLSFGQKPEEEGNSGKSGKERRESSGDKPGEIMRKDPTAGKLDDTKVPD